MGPEQEAPFAEGAEKPNFPNTCSRGPPGNTLETFVGASVTRHAQIFSGSPRRCQFRRAHGDHVAGFVRHQSSGPVFGRRFFAFCAYSTLSQYFLDHSPGLVCVLIRTGKHSLFHLFSPRTPQLFVYLFRCFYVTVRLRPAVTPPLVLRQM